MVNIWYCKILKIVAKSERNWPNFASQVMKLEKDKNSFEKKNFPAVACLQSVIFFIFFRTIPLLPAAEQFEI